MNVYVILNSEGKMSRGGQQPKFDAWGKFWRKAGSITNHLIGMETRSKSRWHQNQNQSDPDAVYAGCEVVEYELVEVSRKPVREFIEGYRERRRKKAKESEDAAAARKRASDLKMLKKLQAQYPDDS